MYGADYPKDNNCGGRCIGRMLRVLGNKGIDFSELLAVAKGQGKLLNATEAAQGPGIYFVSQRSGPKKIEPPKDPSCGALCSVGFATQQLLGCKTQTSCVAQAAMFFLPAGELRAGLRAEKGALQATRAGRAAEGGIGLGARTADNEALQNTLARLYKPGQKYEGGTAGALREEARSGIKVFGRNHRASAEQNVNALTKILSGERGPLSTQDRYTATRNLRDLEDAIRFFDSKRPGGYIR